jgi:hypothetical protein
LTVEKESSVQRGKPDGAQFTKDLRKQIRDLNERLHQLAIEAEEDADDEVESDNSTEEANPPYDAQPPPVIASEQESVLRNRRAELLSTSKLQSTTTGTSLPQTGKAAVLETQESEQMALTSSLVEMARALKASTRKFGQTLEAEKGDLDRAGQGLEKNKDGLDAAGKKMGMLRKMSEGRGFMGRLMIYGYIAALWLIAIALLFLPKLRF